LQTAATGALENPENDEQAQRGSNPASSELTVNRKMQIRKKRLRPNSPASQPLMGRTTAFETR
jgi:hypothetical protein